MALQSFAKKVAHARLKRLHRWRELKMLLLPGPHIFHYICYWGTHITHHYQGQHILDNSDFRLSKNAVSIKVF